jgi:hypothetical protein
VSILYPWARPEAIHDANVQSKAMYLNVPFFIGRAVFYFLVWSLYSYLLSKWSAEQDRTGDDRLISKMHALSAPGLVVFTLTTSFAFIDWIMSLEPHWFSTIYGVMFMVGEMLESFAFVIALMIVLSKAPPIKEFVTPQHVHDLGNMMFAFMVLWAYLSFSQFLGRQSSGRDPVVSQPSAWRLGLGGADHCGLSLCGAVRLAVVPRHQAPRGSSPPRLRADDRHPAGGRLLDHGTRLLRSATTPSLD